MIRCFRYHTACHAEATVNKKFGGTYVPACRRCAADIDALKSKPATAPSAEPAPPPPRWRLRPNADDHPELCRVDGCRRKVARRGVCRFHFEEMRTAGDMSIAIPAMTAHEVARMGQAARKAKDAAMCEKLAG